jgi:hypothetical protein
MGDSKMERFGGGTIHSKAARPVRVPLRQYQDQKEERICGANCFTVCCLCCCFYRNGKGWGVILVTGSATLLVTTLFRPTNQNFTRGDASVSKAISLF